MKLGTYIDSGIDFKAALLRLKTELNTPTDKALAGVLGMSATALNDRKRRGAFPDDKLLALIGKRPDLGIDYDYVVTGHRAQEFEAAIAKERAGEARPAPNTPLSKTAVAARITRGKDGQPLAVVSALKLVTEQARAVVAAAPDEDDAMNQALVRITQEKLFTLMMDLEIDPKTVDIAKITKSIADLARSSINVKKFRAEVEVETRKRIRQEQNEKLESGLKARGLGPETADWFRREVLGMA